MEKKYLPNQQKMDLVQLDQHLSSATNKNPQDIPLMLGLYESILKKT